MRQRLFIIALLLALYIASAPAQSPESFFPSQVGNLWQYYSPQVSTPNEDWSILQDSVASDGYRYLFVRFLRYPGQERWWYRLDSKFSVYQYPNFWSDTLYRLTADSGDVWLRSGIPGDGYYSWVLHVSQGVVFGRAATIKVIRSGPFHPDSGGNSFYFYEQHLASGFGVIYHLEESGYVTFLRACVIAGDTFGIVVSAPQSSAELPATTTLHQNYPNPFNPTTAIEYHVAQREFVRLRVFDILGRGVSTLAEGVHESGKYKVRFDGTCLSSGVYICRIETSTATQTKRMLLIK